MKFLAYFSSHLIKLIFSLLMDINDAFEQILLSEERIAEESYKKGFEKGVTEGNLEAYHIGTKTFIIIFINRRQYYTMNEL